MKVDLRRSAAGILFRLPDAVREGPLHRLVGYRRADVPRPVRADTDAATRLLIAPANYAGQAYAWARAAECLPGVFAANLQIGESVVFRHPSTATVPARIAAGSRRWGRDQFEAVVDTFTHVLVEAERPIFGRLFAGDVIAEVRALRARGVRVAVVSHGTDIRSPERHRRVEPWSPFGPDDPIESVVQRNRLILDTICADERTAVFVSTTDLLRDLPRATWLPVVIDAEPWAASVPRTGRRSRLHVFHAPSSGRLKGTDHILPVLERLADEGVIRLDLPTGLPHAEMIDRVAAADVVLDQFLLGGYGVAACEAMAAGRIVVGHVDREVRNTAATMAGMPLPILESSPAELETVLRDLAADPVPEVSRAAQNGPEFVRRVHAGSVSAKALASFLDVLQG